ncbi:uncharacterized protein BJX67DRAFT_223389 [Aspergillus lucknowensis]|uniref:Uncharacterized protein n=1 Tax=Aspergillus lucknowensis TaxID=176173 RepID=A0ABR4LJP5_9EURO
MSLPKPTSSPPLSSSPSKQSVRRLSQPHSIDEQIVRASDTPNKYPTQHTPATNLESDFAEEDEQAHREQPPPYQILSQPFFTLIEDTHTSEYYHPTVHYIFSDDDTDIVTEAALRSLESEGDTLSNTNTKGKTKATSANPRQQPPDGGDEPFGEESATRKESLLPDPVPGVRDNYIILDIGRSPSAQEFKNPMAGSPDTQDQTQQDTKEPREQDRPSSPHDFTVTSAHSLSPSWQVLNTSLLPAPAFEGSSSGEEPLNGGLMLQIQGTSGLPIGAMGKDKERSSQRLEEMMDQFARRLDELRLVIESGEQGMPVRIEGSIHDARLLAGRDTRDLTTNPHDPGNEEASRERESELPQ